MSEYVHQKSILDVLWMSEETNSSVLKDKANLFVSHSEKTMLEPARRK